MVDVPSFFNRVDFVGKLLPGYLTVTVYLLLFHYDLLISKGETSGEGGPIAADILTAIIFVVAGPAIGYAIARFQRSLPYIRHRIFGFANITVEESWWDYTRNYAIMRIEMCSEEKNELDQTEAENDFLASTGVGLIVVGLYYTYKVLSGTPSPEYIYLIALYGFGTGLLVAAKIHRRLSFDRFLMLFLLNIRRNSLNRMSLRRIFPLGTTKS